VYFVLLLYLEHLSALLEQSKLSRDSDDYIFFKTVFPRLKAWFNWFNTSQAGNGSRFSDAG
jgi:hypothetical protein